MDEDFGRVMAGGVGHRSMTELSVESYTSPNLVVMSGCRRVLSVGIALQLPPLVTAGQCEAIGESKARRFPSKLAVLPQSVE